MTIDLDSIFYEDFYGAKWQTLPGQIRALKWSIEDYGATDTGLTASHISSIQSAFEIWDDAIESIKFIELPSNSTADITLSAFYVDGPESIFAEWSYDFNEDMHITYATIGFDSDDLNNGYLFTTAMHEIGNILGLGDLAVSDDYRSVQEDPFPEVFTGNMLWDFDRRMINSLYLNTDEEVVPPSHPTPKPAPEIEPITVINGTNRSETIKGTKANETINGLGGKDLLSGLGGDDFLYGGLGHDTLNGGSGKDVLNGGAGNDKLNGGVGKDLLVGESGNDKLNGGIGKDSLNGGLGKDVLNGGAANDKLKGGIGKDLLIGGSGIDRLHGGAGKDTFRIRKGSGYDIIQDFTNGKDRIHLASGISEMSISNQGNDLVIYQGNDLLAQIKNVDNQLQFSGNYLI